MQDRWRRARKVHTRTRYKLSFRRADYYKARITMFDARERERDIYIEREKAKERETEEEKQRKRE